MLAAGSLHQHSGHLILFFGWLAFFVGAVVVRQLYAPTPTNPQAGPAPKPAAAGTGGNEPVDREFIRVCLFVLGAIGVVLAGICSLLSANHRYPQTSIESSLAAAYLCLAGWLMLRPTPGALIADAVTTTAALILLVTELTAGDGLAR
jgi:hypothetical protein